MDQELEAASARLAQRELLFEKAYNKANKLRTNFKAASKKVRKTRKALIASKLQVETIKRRGHIEEIFWRLPHVGTQILEKLDTQSLRRCREVNSWWKQIIDSDKIIVIRKIQHYIGLSNNSVKKKLQKNTSKFLKELAFFVEERNYDWPKSPLALFFYLTTSSHHESEGMYLWKLLFDNIDNKNPIYSASHEIVDGLALLDHMSALFIAASLGNLEACKCIMEHVKDLNPESDGNTAIHAAILHGRYDLCQYFIEKGVDLNMKDVIGRTPLEFAKEKNETEIVKLIEASVSLNNLT